jgi:uncharacterized repeat protein (TIGR01451 family)
MRKILLLLLLFTRIAYGQFVEIPDPNFKAKLLEAGVALDIEYQSTQIDADSDGEIDFDEAANIAVLSIDNANITSLEGIDAFVNLKNLECENNLFTILDISTLPLLDILYAGFNPNLTYLILKNGLINFNVPPPPPTPPGIGGANFSNCPNLQYVCIGDEFYQDGLDYLFYFFTPNAITLNSYCSFNPAGQYNTITGKVLFDQDNNDCDPNDNAFAYVKVNINDGIGVGNTFVAADGTFTFYTHAGNFTLTPEMENTNYFSFSPSNAVINFPVVDNSTQTQNFCITANGVHPDLEVILTPIGVARPGFDSEYKIVYKNKGNQTQSGTVNLTFDDLRTDFVSATPTVDTQLVSTLTWNFSNLQPFATRVINLTLNVNTPLEIPAVNNGDILNFDATINASANDETPLDNAFDFSQTVVNSYDPNDKTCLEGNTITPENIGKYLHYNINFENIGTADAVNIVVKDIIDTAKFDINSLQLLYASHAVETKISGNKVEFIFENINLPSSIQNPIGGHGNVLFKIKTIESLVVGDEVSNTANIFFDYNAPIQTNEARTIIATLSKDNFIKDETIIVAPNPTKNRITVSAKNKLKSVFLFDAQGRLLQTVLEHNKTTTVDISDQSNGIYFLKVITEVGSSVEKIVKEN